MRRRILAVGLAVALAFTAAGIAAASGGLSPAEARAKAQAIRYDLKHSHHAARSLLAAYAVFAIKSRTGVKTRAGDIISRPPLSSLPFRALSWPPRLFDLFQLDFTQVRQVITPSGVRLYVIPGRRALCLATDGGGTCNLLPGVEVHGLYLRSGSNGVSRTYRLLPKTFHSISIHTGQGPRTVPVPDGIYVSPATRP